VPAISGVSATATLAPSPLLDRLRETVPALAVDADTWVRRMMRWHFSEETGSPFWLRRRAALGFDPLRDVAGLADLDRFGLFDKPALRTAPAADLVPRGFAHRPRRIFETGGTTGRPCRVADVTTGEINVRVYRAMLELRGLAGGDALAMTPSGPHAYGAFVARLADSWAGNTLAVDFDPRWVKRLLRAGQPVEPYVEHLIEQTVELLDLHRPRLLFTTSKLLLELAPALPRPLAAYGVRGVCTGGTSCTAEETRYLEENHLQGVQWIDTYGNTLMGHALQGDPWAGCARRAYYLPPPLGFIRLVDAADWRQPVAMGERGRVLLVTLLEDLFLPNLLERDSAVRTGPHPWFPWEGVRDVQPYAAAGEAAATEGVY
jgi:phenylacetate-coenzyme A ligase PaaK-like adenylate-forming protein